MEPGDSVTSAVGSPMMTHDTELITRTSDFYGALTMFHALGAARGFTSAHLTTTHRPRTRCHVSCPSEHPEAQQGANLPKAELGFELQEWTGSPTATITASLTCRPVWRPSRPYVLGHKFGQDTPAGGWNS